MLRGIGKRYENIKRYRQIGFILAKYGFNTITEKMDSKNFIRNIFFKGKKEFSRKYTRAQRIRMAIEELGPTFIKLGQIMSTRYDILPADIVKELALLQDKVPEFELSYAKKIFKEELGKELDEVFSYFDDKPIAAASIGQVYGGILKTGEEVVIKIQRPNIQKIISTDIDILLSIAKLIDEHFNNQSPFNAVDIVNEFSYLIKKELDYTYEAQNCETFRENYKNSNKVYIPKIYWEYTTKRVLVMERIRGTKISDLDEYNRLDYDKNELAKLGARVFMEQILIHGFFHGDPHPGNVMIVDNSKIGFIDFGIVGYIDKITLDFLVTLLESGYRKNIDRIIENLNEMEAITGETKILELRRDMHYLLNYYFNIPMNKIRFSDAFVEILSMAYRHKLKLPSQLILLIKAIVTIEGTGRRLNPRFNLTMITKDIFKDISKEKLKPKKMVDDAIKFSKENLKDLKNLPKRVSNVLQRTEKNQLKFIVQLEGLRKLEREINTLTNKLSLSLLVSSIIVGSSLVIEADVGPKILGISAIGLVGFMAAGILGLSLVISILLNSMRNK
jgi:ubiquinone biosynthesis protein